MSSSDNEDLEILYGLIKTQPAKKNAKHYWRTMKKSVTKSGADSGVQRNKKSPEEKEMENLRSDLEKVHADAVKWSSFRAVATLYKWDKTKISKPKSKGGFRPMK